MVDAVADARQIKQHLTALAAQAAIVLLAVDVVARPRIYRTANVVLAAQLLLTVAAATIAHVLWMAKMVVAVLPDVVPVAQMVFVLYLKN